MARSFTGSTANRLRLGSAPVTTAPISMACWYTVAANGSGYGLMTLESTSAVEWFRLTVQGNAAGNPLRAQVQATGVLTADSTGDGEASLNTFLHAGARFNGSGASTSADVFLEGSKDSSGSGSVSPTANSLALGAWREDIGWIQPHNGLIAWPCIWDIALSDSDFSALAARAHPLSIHPESIIWFPGDMHGTGNEIDFIGGTTLVETGTVGADESILLGLSSITSQSSVVVAGGATPKGPLGMPLQGPFGGPI